MGIYVWTTYNFDLCGMVLALLFKFYSEIDVDCEEQA